MEDGEIVDDVDEDYTPLQRPSEPEPSHRAMTVADDSEPSEEESESEDSDDPNRGKKKPKLKPKIPKNRPNEKAANKYNIWCSNIQEEVLTQGLTNCDVDKRYKRNRDVESYDYFSHRSNEPTDEAPRSNKRMHNEHREGNARARLGRRVYSNDDGRRGTSKILLDLHVTAESTEEEVAKDIANKLCEEKDDLILRVVQILGKQASIDLFNLTRAIEVGGGMLVMNQTRRRTPGGVYLFHAKDRATQEQIQQIFFDDRKQYDAHKKAERSKKRRARAQASHGAVEQAGTMLELPPSPSAEALSCEEEECGGTSNPPPSPVTDGRADSSPEACPLPQLVAAAQIQQETVQRTLTTYDDFLDLGDENMEEF